MGLQALPVDREDTASKSLLASLVSGWFSSTRSTEAMKRGTKNEKAVLSALSNQSYIKALFELGMIGRRGFDWIACSPDAVAVIDSTQMEFADSLFHGSGTTVMPGGNQFPLATVEIKTSVAESSLEVSLALSTAETTCFDVGDPFSRETITEEHFSKCYNK